MTEILYRSDTLEVRRVAAAEMRRQVVTFDSYHDAAGFDRPAFAEHYLATHGIAAIHILSHRNDWFQYPEMEAVLATVRAALTGTERVLAYGSSMGGYGAIRFADRIGAHAVLALSPQYSVDRRKARFERRWMQDQRRIRFLAQLDGPIRCGVPVVVAYDPELAQDRQHVALIAADIAIQPLPLPHAGHPAGAFLSDVGLLKPLVEQMIAGDPDLAEMASAATARRAQSSAWLGERAASIAPGPEAIALAEQALALDPDSPPVHDRLARQLAAAGDYARAIPAHHRAIALGSGDAMPGYRWNLSKTLAAAGDLPAALEAARTLQQLAPTVAGHHRWAADLRLLLGDRTGALADLKAALREAPTNPGYRASAWRLGWQIRLTRWFGRSRG